SSTEISFLISCPEKTAREERTHDNRWFNNNLKDLRDNLRLVSDLHDKYKNEPFKNLRRRFRVLYRVELKRAKVAYNDKLISESSNKSKTLLNIVNNKRNKNSNSFHNTLSPQKFNDYFVSIPLQIPNSLGNCTGDPAATFRRDIPSDAKLDFSEVTFNKVRDIAHNLNG
ncbi:hypothetical protein HHI36_016656, partial [Cryptolaemus montrouzieri]